MTRELLQQALDALIYHRDQTRPIDRTDAAITALREALAAPMPEPVAWRWRERPHESRSWGDWRYMVNNKPQGPASATFEMEPLYAAPPAAPAPVVSDKATVDYVTTIEVLRAHIARLESAAPVGPLTDEQKQGLLHQVGIVTGANLTGMYGQRYRSLGTPYNVWEKDLFALIDAARAHGIGGGDK